MFMSQAGAASAQQASRVSGAVVLSLQACGLLGCRQGRRFADNRCGADWSSCGSNNAMAMLCWGYLHVRWTPHEGRCRRL